MRDLTAQADTEILACKAGYMLELAAAASSAGDEENATAAATDVPKTALKEVGSLSHVPVGTYRLSNGNK